MRGKTEPVDSLFESVACPNMTALLLAKFTYFIYFESIKERKVYYYTDKLKSEKVSVTDSVLSLSDGINVFCALTF